LDNDLEFEPLVVPEAFLSPEDPEGRNWTPKFCAPTPDGTGLVVGDGQAIVLLRF